MANLIQEFENKQLETIRQNRAESKNFDVSFKVGDSVKVQYKISEGGNTRLQAFIGVVIARAKNSNHYSATFTVRKMSSGIGVERTFTINSPLISSIEITKKGIVRRSKLYYLRSLTGKAARIREKLDFLTKKKSSS
jgi:large subunit ribosomal protein L19